MPLSSPNEPTETHDVQEGAKHRRPVYDTDGLLVGYVHDHEDVDVMSEDVGRVIIHLSEDAQRALDVDLPEADVESAWLHQADTGDGIVLEKPLREALVEQGFNL